MSVTINIEIYVMLDPKLLCESLDRQYPKKLIKDWTHSPSDTDEIIQEMLKSRLEQTDVDKQHEQERQRRMYSMLRNSSHFKKLQVAHANQHWSLELDELADALNGTFV
jgi:hypothetical protein